MKIYLARHGQSRWQVERGEDDRDSPLTPLGRQQAQRLGDWLGNDRHLDNGSCLDIQAVYASPLERARETAVYTTTALALPLTILDPLTEATFLVSQHLPSAAHPAGPPPPFSPSGDYAAFKKQAQTALERLVGEAEQQGGPILAFAHGGLISTLLRIAAGSDAVSFWIYNTSLNLIEWKRGRWHFVFLNLWDHLPPEMRTY